MQQARRRKVLLVEDDAIVALAFVTLPSSR